MKRTGSSIFAKRFLALLMVVVMLAAQLPTMAWADEGVPVDPPAEGEPAPQAETAGTDAGGTDTATVTPTPVPETTPEAKDEGTTPVPETTPEAKDEGTKATPVPETTPEAKDERTKATPETTPEAKGDDAKAPTTGGDETTTYTVTLDFNGETPASASGLTAVEGATGKYTFTYTADNTSLPTLASKQGWYLWENDTFTDSIVKNVGAAESGKTYKLRHTYTVTFALGYEGAPAADIKDVLEGKPVAQPENPTREGDYRFDRWMNGTDAYVFTTSVGSDITLTATWVETYTVTYTGEYGDAPVSTTADKGQEMALPQMDDVASHTFRGWKINGTTYIDKYTGNASVTAEAQWEIKKYTVNFYGDITASDASATVTSVEHGSTVAEYPSDGTAVTAPEGANEELVRWDAYADGKYTEFKLGETQVTADTDLYARWSYNISYVNNEGATVEEGKTLPATYVAGEETTIPTLTKEGYTFTGWKNGTGEGAESVTKIAATQTGPVTLYATWQLNSDNYEVEANGTTLTVTEGKTDWTNAETVTIAPTGVAKKLLTSTDDFATDKNTTENESIVIKCAENAEKTEAVSFKLTDGTNTPSKTVDVNVRIDRTAPTVTFAYAGIGNGIVEEDENNVQMSSNGVTVAINVDEAHLPAEWNEDEDVKVKLVNNSDKSEKDKTKDVAWLDKTGIVRISATELGGYDEGTTYTLVVTGITDEAGNTCAATTSDVLAYDGSEPAVTVMNLIESLPEGRNYSNGYYNGEYQVKIEVTSSFLTKANIASYVTVTLDSDDTKATTLVWSRDEINKKVWTATLNVTGAGKHTVSAKIDVAGKSRESDPATAYIDTTAPTGSIRMDGSEVPERPVVAASHKVLAEFADRALAESAPGSGVAETQYYITASTGYDSVSLKVNGADYTLGTDTACDGELQITTDGRFEGTIYFYAVDNVENSGKDSEDAAELVSAALSLDGKAPEVNVTSGSAENVTNENVTVTLTVTDDNINLLAAPGENGENTADIAVTMDEKAFDGYTATGWSFDKGQGAWTNKLTIEPDATDAHSKDGVYTVTLGATDSCGNTTADENKKSVSFTIDTIDAVTAIVFAENGAPTDGTENPTKEATYYSHNDVIYTLTVSDTNLKLTEDGKPAVTINWTKGNVSTDDLVWEQDKTDATKWTATLTIPANAGEYSFTLEADDKAGNGSNTSDSGKLVIDTTAPEIKQTTVTGAKTTEPPESASGKTVYYSNGGITATFSVSDKYLNKDTIEATVLKNGTALLSSESTAKAEVEKETVTLTLLNSAEDGCYQVKIVAKDYAGNTTTYTSNYYIIDKTAPTGTITATGSGTDEFSANWRAGHSEIKVSLLDRILSAFGFEKFAKNQINVTFSYEDESTAYVTDINGVKTAEYLEYDYSDEHTTPYTDVSSLKDAKDWKNVETLTEKELIVNKDQKFVVYLRVEDKAGNVTYLSSDGMIVEDEVPVGKDTSAPSITVTRKDNKGLNSNSINVDAAYLTVNVLEKPALIFSGIKPSEGVQYASNNGAVTISAPNNALVSVKNDDGLEESRTQDVTLTVPNEFENNNVVFTVTATDNSGNENDAEVVLNIDNRSPTATIRYDNNEVYNNKYFNQPRVATITVTELNFDENNTRVNTTGSRSGWTRSNETHSTATNTATVSYTTDGDYTLDFQTTDKAGHTLYDSGVTYEGNAPQEFTIDMTKPRATITFRDADGNEVPSGGYANSTVTATITIVEHNFDANSATNGIRITRDGETYRANVSWSTSGDTHTATIPFIEEEGALYTFDMSFVDLANNECDPFQRVSFYVDTMLPSITVSEIANNSANNAATIAPVVTVTDKYYDPNGVTVTLTGAKNGVVASAYSVSDVENGQQFTFENIEKDDIYTLTVKATDLAGNVNEEMFVEETGDTTDRVTFSVNREGSTYGVDEDTQALLKQYYTNKLDKDLKLTIINVDEIDPADLIVTVSLGLLDSRDLVEGEDYSIDMQPITGGYMYTVTIFKEVFDKDGAYTISVFTKDKAGNTSTNVTADDEHGMEMAFYLDTQAPTIVLNDLGKGKTYSVERYEDGSVSVSDQTLDEITVVLTYRTGEVATYVWDSEEIYSAEFNGTYLALLSGSRAIEQSKRSINIRVTAKDKAGNVAEGPYTETDGGIVVDEEYNFYVTTNPLTRFYANKGLFFGSIGGLVVLAAVVTGLVLSKKKKKATV